MPDWLIEAAKQRGPEVALLIVAVAFYRYIAPGIGKFFKTKVAAKAVTELNGKLVEAVRLAIQPLIKESMEATFDARFREMPEFIREKIRGLGEHGANNAILVWDGKNNILSRIGFLELEKTTSDAWRKDRDKDDDAREGRIHDMEIALARLDEVQKGQKALTEMLAEMKKSVDLRNSHK